MASFDAISAIGSHRTEGKDKIHNNGGMYMADNKKLEEENPLSNKNLPGGLFTHPGVNC